MITTINMLQTLLVIVVIIYCVYLYLTWNYDYWKKRNLPHLPPTIGFGNMKDAFLIRRPIQHIHLEVYKTFSDYKYVGFFNMRQPFIFIRDLDLIRAILIKDFSSFNSNGVELNERNNPLLTKNLSALDGEKWKAVKSKVSPGLSSGRVKMMFPQMVRAAERLVNSIANDQDNLEGKGVETKEICLKYTVASVASCAMSLQVNAFDDPNSEFRQIGRKIFNTDDYKTNIKFLLIFLSPRIAKFFGVTLIPKDVDEFLRNLIKEQINYRKRNNAIYNDFMDFMIEVQQKCKEYDFDETYIAAQLITFFTDGIETSSVAISYTLFEIASHPHVQKKLWNEIEEVIAKNNGEMTYDGVMQEMKYLDCVVHEALRLRTPAVFEKKKCVVPYKMPPAKDGMPELEVKPGQRVIISFYSIMRDPQYFPNPDTFDPERFNDERRKDIAKNSFLAFSEGPRQCSGMRFVLMQMKVGVVAIIRNFEVRLHHRTKLPLQDDPTFFIMKPLGGIWLTFHKRK